MLCQVHGHPQLTYLKHKMPDPKGGITVEGSFKQAFYCEQDCVAQAAALIAPMILMALAATQEGHRQRKQPRQQ